MGTLYQYRCSACGYEAQVSGGEDAGEMAGTTTILCEDCCKLWDVVVARIEPGPVFHNLVPICPRSSRHKVRPWVYPDSCPRCSELMARGQVVRLWD